MKPKITKISDNQYIVEQTLPLKEILKWRLARRIERLLIKEYQKIQADDYNSQCGDR